jgi:hypothetical protein
VSTKTATEAVYRDHFQRNLENDWALYRLAQSLTCPKKCDEAGVVGDQFKKAWKKADVTLTASAFLRRIECGNIEPS